jgi:hypothetical protein
MADATSALLTIERLKSALRIGHIDASLVREAVALLEQRRTRGVNVEPCQKCERDKQLAAARHNRFRSRRRQARASQQMETRP